MSQKICIIGYYDSGNAGDLWLKNQTKKWVSQTLVKTPQFIEHSIHNKWSTFLKITQADTVVFGGGSLLQDIGSQKSVAYYALLIIWAKLRNKPVYLISHGIGPVYRKLTIWLLKKALPNCIITLRDQESLTVLNTLDIIPKSVTVTADLAYYNQIPTPNTPSLEECPTTGVGVLISLKPSPITSALKDIITQLNDAGFDIQGLIADTSQDTVTTLITLQNKQYFTLKDHIQPFHTPKIAMPKAHLLITMRYHSAVWASLNGIPFIAISDDSKLISLATDLKQSHISLSQAPHQLMSTIKTTLKNYDTLQHHLISGVSQKIAALT
jgi:polysaccharide pyruvyl transferase WcaK-like protein